MVAFPSGTITIRFEWIVSRDEYFSEGLPIKISIGTFRMSVVAFNSFGGLFKEKNFTFSVCFYKTRTLLLKMDMRSSRMVRASDSHCCIRVRSRVHPSIPKHIGIVWAADKQC
jgi:hypothetical protein